MGERTYIACDLKSFYASVEAMERGLDPMTTHLVVADQSRTEKTICLAVSPSLKAYGISGRARLFEVVQRVKEVNAQRQRQAPGRTFAGSSYDAPTLKRSPELAIDYVVAPPRMALYMKRSTEIYNIYLKYISPEDIHVYSIDEVNGRDQLLTDLPPYGAGAGYEDHSGRAENHRHHSDGGYRDKPLFMQSRYGYRRKAYSGR